MKQYILISILLVLTSQQLTAHPRCVNLGCACVTYEMSTQVAIRCLRETMHCYEQVRCVFRRGECRYTRQWWLDRCINNSTLTARDPCVVSGCNRMQCVRRSQATSSPTKCPANPFAVCYEHATCEQRPWGTCGWVTTPAFRTCWANVITNN
jgi:hypothetical protein